MYAPTKSIWRNTAALKNTKIKETMFFFNQPLLPTRARDHRIDRTLRTHGCSTIPMDFIRGQLGPVRNPRISFALIAAYISATWNERREGRTPSANEIESLWASTLIPTQMCMFLFLSFLPFCLLLFCSVSLLYQCFPLLLSLFFFLIMQLVN